MKFYRRMMKNRDVNTCLGVRTLQILKPKHTTLRCLFIAAVCTVAMGCNNSKGSDDGSEKGTGDDNIVPIGDAGVDAGGVTFVCPVDETLGEMDSQQLFDWPTVPTFDIYLPPERWAQLQIDARDEVYVQAEACFEGRGLGTVGLRFKGSYGSLYNCFDETDTMICRKLGMKLKFSEYDLDKRFFGMKRLNFPGYRYDDSYMKEKLSHDLYRAMDIKAPRVSWAQIRVNDELMGLYGMVEQVDGRFTDNRWPDNGDGNLYKELWPDTTDDAYILSKLKTNAETSAIEGFKGFATAMKSADPANPRATLGNYVDLDCWARYMAVDDAIANYDGITTYWTTAEADGAGNHNFYLYEENPNLFTIIPWDLESTLALGGFGNVPRWTEVPGDCSIVYPIWGNEDDLAMAPGCNVIFQALAQDLESYKQAGRRLLDGPYQEAVMAATIDDHVAFLKEAATADPNGPGVVEFEKNAEFIKGNISRLRARLEHLLTGEPYVPFEIGVDEVTDLETQDDFGLIMTAEVYASEGTTISYEINSETPLFGERSLHLSFQFSPTGETWVSYEVPLKGGANDVTALTGIRLWTRADSERQFRIEVDSPHTTPDNNWIRVGWNFEVTPETTQIELLLTDAKAPSWATSQGLEITVPLTEILAAINGMIFRPENGKNGTQGFVDIDNIEFF